jgi:hypothetical protein
VLITMARMIDNITSVAARASIVWVIGEYAEVRARPCRCGRG